MTPAAKIGLFMLIGLVILGVFVIEIEDIPVTDRGERLQVEATFPTVAGLDPKAPVRIAGVRVGKVAAVRLDGRRAVLTLSLDPDVRLYADATARIAALGMLGDKYVEILPGTPQAGPLPPGAVLQGGSPPTFDEVLKIATEIGADVKEVTRALRLSVGGEEGAARISEIVENVRTLTAELRHLVEANRGGVSETVDNFRVASGTLREELPRIAARLDALADSLQQVVGENREDLHASLVNIRDLSARLRTSADNLNTITGRIARGEGTLGKLVNDDTTVENLNATLESIQGGVETLQETVGRFQRYRLDVTLGSEALPGVDASRTTFGFDLWTSDRRFFRVEYVDSPFGKRKEKSETVTTVWDDGRTETYTRTSRKMDDTGTYNAQIGFRLFSRTVVRAGLFESQGGVAVDQHLEVASRPLLLSLAAYDFDRTEDGSPHLRLEGRYYLTPNVFLSAGWDDPTYSERSSVLLGAGITWTDEDMKYMLGLASRGF